MSPLSSPPVTTPATVRQAPQSQPTLSSPAPAPVQSSPAPQRPISTHQPPVTPVTQTPLNQPSPSRNEIEISDSGSDTESDDEDIPVSALLGRQQQQQPTSYEPPRAVSTYSTPSSSASQVFSINNSNSNIPESRVKAETGRMRIPMQNAEVPLAESLGSARPEPGTLACEQQLVSAFNEQQLTANVSKNQLKKLKKKKSRAIKKATAGSGLIVHMSVSKANRAERRRQQFQTQA